MKKVDYIIVGQGLAGSTLAWELLNRHRSVVVFDEPLSNRASRIAAGICNPITGKGMVSTYKADLLFPFLHQFYSNAERILGRKFFQPLSVYRPFISNEEMLQWNAKSQRRELSDFVARIYQSPHMEQAIHDPFGGMEIRQSGYLRVTEWIDAIRHLLLSKDAYRNERFRENELKVDDSIAYGDFISKKIVFCNGLAALESNWFRWLPLRPLKGEILEVNIPFVPHHIFSRGIYIVPSLKDENFLVGSTYQHPPYSEGPTEAVSFELQTKLRDLIKLPFKVLHQDWGIRPTVTDRRPLLGHHPVNKNVIIFNGLGTKGVSLAPYFAKCLADWMDGGEDLPQEVNICRFKSLYSG